MKKMFKKLIVVMLCFLVFAGIFAGCAAPQEGAETPGPEPSVPQQVVAGLGRDPGEMYGYGAHPPLTRVLEPLIFQDLELGLKPGLAARWEASEDGLTWDIFLQEGVKFHDGTPFNAEAVVHNLKRLTKGWPGRFGEVETIEAVGEFQVEVIHSEPYAPFLYSLAWAGAAMISPAVVDAEGNVAEPMGTGPFMKESWAPGEEMVLVRNADYWGGTPILERITLKYIPDPTTRMMALEAGEIDMIIDTGGVLPEQVPTLRKNEQIEVLTIEGAVPHYMTLNTQKAPLNDVQVRQAVMYALDPQSIIKYALEGFGRTMTSVIPYSEKGWMHSETLYPFNDPDRAKELLQKAGWEDRNGDGILEKDGQECRVKFLLSSALVGRWPYQPIAEIVQAQLADVGIEVKIEVVETGLWKETLQKGEADLSIRPWAGISPQSRLHEWLHSEGENSLAMGIFYHNPQVDSLIEKLLSTTEEKEAKEISLEIQKLAADEVPIIPMYDEVLINAVRKNIKGYKLHPWFSVNWEDIYVEGN
jgi:peptide/nickel transport system substrate-binding protein